MMFGIELETVFCCVKVEESTDTICVLITHTACDVMFYISSTSS